MPDYIPRRIVSSIYGPRNAGKTQCAVWLAAEASKGVTGAKLRVWFNSQEDDLATVLKPRLSAAGVDLSPQAHQVRLTDERWRLPGDLKAIREQLEQHKAGGAPDDILILDSIQQHLLRPYHHAPCAETMTGLIAIAADFK